ncbi:MAG: serine hydrolase [Bacteroidota bacterium]
MRSFLPALLTLFALLSSSAWLDAHPAPSVDDLTTTIDAIVEEEMRDTHLPGVAVVVVKDGATLVQRGYGVADVASSRPVDPERTLFRIGSVSKALTALAVTRLIDDGRLAYDDDVSAYVDGIANLSGSDEPVTIEHLLTHTAAFDQIGLDRHVWDLDQTLAQRKAQRPSLAAYLEAGNLRRTHAAGQRFRYDTYGITLAGLVLERVTGLPYDQAMRQELFAPLGMERSFVEVDAAHVDDLAVGHGWVDSAYVAQPYEVYVTTPASSIDATPADMGRLLEAMTGSGASGQGRLFSPAATRAVLAPQFRPAPGFTGVTHGFWESPGFDLPDGPAIRTVGHGGSMLGYWTSLTLYPDANVGVFIVTNRNHEAGGGFVNVGQRINEVIAEAFYDDVPSPLMPLSVPLDGRDLSPYVGDYTFGTFCRTCSRDERARGAWGVSALRPVRLTERGLSLNDQPYLPTAERDVFVHESGDRALHFGRDAEGRIDFLVRSEEPATLERVPAMTTLREGMHEAAVYLDAGFPLKATEVLRAALDAGLDAGILNEAAINATGYATLGEDSTTMALLIFAYNADVFPDSWNVHDSLGEALALAGRTDEAIAAYERSLSLNPESEGGLAALKRLRARRGN